MAAALALAWVVWTVARTWGETPQDMTALYYAARFWAEGQMDLIFAATGPQLLWETPPQAWAEMSQSFGEPVGQLTAYVYPPLWAALLSPLAAHTEPATFYAIAMATFTAIYASGLIAAGRVFAHDFPPLHWLALALLLTELTATGRLSIGLGQTQILVTGLILFAFTAYSKGHPGRAGTLLAVAASIKLTPLFFALIFLADRSLRALAAFIFAGTALAALSIALTGWPLHAEFLARLGTMSDTLLLSKINLSLSAALTMLASGDLTLMTYAWTPVPALIGLVSPLLLATALLAVYLLRRRHPDTRGLWMALVAIGLAIPLTAPLGWLHYMLLPLALAPALAQSRPITLALFAAAFSVPLYDVLLVQPVIWPQLYGTALTLAAFLGALWLGFRTARP